MQNNQEDTSFGKYVKFLVAENLDQAGKAALDLVGQVLECDTIEHAESILLQKMPEIVGRFFVACKAVISKNRRWMTEEIIFGSIYVVEKIQIEFDRKDEDVGKLGGILLSPLGIPQSKSLTVEEILGRCFRNPNRKKFPQFLSERRGKVYTLYHADENKEYWIGKLKQGLVSQFNNKRINLYDTSGFKNRSRDEEPYLSAIKDSSWFGPYKSFLADEFYFVSINRSGDNEYYVYLYIGLQVPEKQCLYIHYRKNDQLIAPGIQFEV